MVKGYIYKHTSPSGKSYIGLTTQMPDSRWKTNGRGYVRPSHQTAFKGAIKKYGWENFTHEILEVVETETKEELIQKLNQLEEDYILRFNTLVPNGYNLCTGGRAHLISNEVKEKISLSNTGKKRSEGARRALGLRTKGRPSPRKGKPGRKLTQSEREYLSLINKGKVLTNETREKMSVAKKGKVLSEETRKKISLANKGRKLSDQVRQKMKGRKLTEEHKQKLILANTGRRASEKVIVKISELNRGKHWYNNGEINIMAYECPDGFVRGKLR